MAAPHLERLLRKIARSDTDSCWEWTGARDSDGYGNFAWTRREITKAHRAAYRLLVGPIPVGLTIDHLCRNHGCVNPAHLEPVTMTENVLRGESFSAVNARKTHCLRGHPLSGENLSMRCDGRRICRTCRRDRERAAA